MLFVNTIFQIIAIVSINLPINILMKNQLPKSLLIIFAIIASLLSCKKDEEVKTNSFKYNDKEALIGTVMSLNWDQIDVNVYGYKLYIFEKTLIIYYSNGYPDSLSGSGDAITLEMHSSDATGIKPGDYRYSESESPYLANTFGLESGLYNFTDASTNDNPIPLKFRSGNVNVKKNGDEYEFTFSINTKSASTITGHFKGKIIPVRFTMAKKSADKNLLSYQFLKH